MARKTPVSTALNLILKIAMPAARSMKMAPMTRAFTCTTTPK